MSSIIRGTLHRHPEGTGYARGEETRARIVDAALKLFGERGFEAASTRDIAAAAGVNAPALRYYFDNKEGVYLACAEHIASHVWGYMAQVVAHAEHALMENESHEALIDAFCAIQGRVVDCMFESEQASEWQLFIAHGQGGQGPVAGFDIINNRLNKPVYSVTTAIVERLMSCAPNDDEARIRSMALNGQLAVFQMMRRTALTSLNWGEVDAQRLELIKCVVIKHTRAVLHAIIAES
ncbi:CerR family C-terminal domain-containing protein [Pseudomonas sp. P154a]|uniref:CerR family C-terminal domain-containing protein n=1 Tax=Pseudomonas TaxID=286 RepID=UPI00071F3805|nr:MULTISPECIES: CerR family C-terminal domain-containing protein [Pseudomonas]MBF6040018.1 CerR family C-terminal domain-containing protein [Pseudomonas mucoides]CRL51804.1 putative HTH-type transcriptional regulator YttP [Pseudomonas sp. URMO17WK12:I11]